MKNSKTLVIVVIALIAANCILMCTLWYKNYGHTTMTPPPAGSAFEYLSKELRLTPAQAKQYSALRNQHFNFSSKVNNELRLERDSFFDNLSNPSANPAQINQLEARILVHQQMLDTATFYHFRKLRTILTLGQQEKFDEVIQNVLHMMGGPHGPQEQHPGQPQAGPLPGMGTQDGLPQGPPPHRGRFNGQYRRPGLGGRMQGGPPPPPYGRPGGPGQRFGPGGPGGPPPQGPPPDGPPPGPPQ